MMKRRRFCLTDPSVSVKHDQGGVGRRMLAPRAIQSGGITHVLYPRRKLTMAKETAFAETETRGNTSLPALVHHLR